MEVNGYKIEPGANLRGANLTGARLVKADLTKANLLEANLAYGVFTRADITEVNFTEANLKGAHLWGVNLNSIHTETSPLVHISRIKSRLEIKYGRAVTLTELATEVEIAEDKVSEALQGSGYAFRGEVILGGVNFQGAVWDESTVWPEGFTPPKQ